MKEKRIEKKLVAAILGLFLLGNSFLFAQEIKEGHNDPATALETQEKGSMEELQFQEKPKVKGYTYNLKRLLEQTEKNIQKVEEEIRQAEVRKRNEEREARAVEHFEKGNQLYQEGNLIEAREQWEKTLELSKTPEMKDYIKEAEKRTRELALARKREEQEQQKRIEAEHKKERLETERRRQLKKQQDLEQKRQKKSKKAAGRRKE